MGLSDAEKLELAQLEKELVPTSSSNLTPSEAEELRALEAELTQPQTPAHNKLKNVESPYNSQAESALQGFGTGATLGYLPKMQAAVMAGLDPELNYEQAKEITQKRDENLARQNPIIYGSGTLAGSVAVPLPGLGAAQGGSAAAKIGKAALQGAAIGGASDTGQDMGSAEDLRSRLERAAVGGSLGGGVQAAGSGLQGLASKLKEYGTFKLLGAKGKDAEKLLERNKAGLNKIDRFLDEEKITGPFTTNADLVKRSDKVLNKSGKQIGNIYDDVQKEAQDLLALTPIASTPDGAKLVEKAISTRLDPLQMGDDFLSKAQNELQGTANGDQIYASLQSQVSNLQKVKPEAGVKGIVEFRKSLDQALKKTYEKPFADISEKQDAMITLRRYIKDRMDEHIDALDQMSQTSSSAKLKKLNSTFSGASTVNRLAGKSEVAQMRNNMFGLPEMIVGTGAAGYQMQKDDPATAIAKGALAAGGLKLSRSYGPAMSRSLGSTLQNVPAMPIRTVVTPWAALSKKEQK